MWKRIQVFNCSSLPSVRRGMEVVYRQQAMEIIHWMVSELKGMDLFQNDYNSTPAYTLSSTAPAFTPRPSDVVLQEPCFDGMETVSSDVLPRNALEMAALDVYAATCPREEIPYRLLSRRYDVAHEAYHRYLSSNNFCFRSDS